MAVELRNGWVVIGTKEKGKENWWYKYTLTNMLKLNGRGRYRIKKHQWQRKETDTEYFRKRTRKKEGEDVEVVGGEEENPSHDGATRGPTEARNNRRKGCNRLWFAVGYIFVLRMSVRCHFVFT